MGDTKNKSIQSALVVFTAGAFFFYSFIQMTLFSTETMKAFFMDSLSIRTTAEFGTFAGFFLYGTVLLLIPVGLLLDKISVRKVILSTLLIAVFCVFGLAYTNVITSYSIHYTKLYDLPRNTSICFSYINTHTI